jgi:DNA repair exonuclease SbcCD ATPase subunit
MSEESLALRAARDRAEHYRTELERMKEERDRLRFRLDFLETAGDEKDGWCEHERRYQMTGGGDGDYCYLCHRDELLDERSELEEEWCAAHNVVKAERDRLQELLDSTTAQLERTQRERDELRDQLDGRVFADARQLGWIPIEVQLIGKVAHLRYELHHWKARWARAMRYIDELGGDLDRRNEAGAP